MSSSRSADAPDPRDTTCPTWKPGTVAVAIATYRHERFIARAIESALSQTRAPDMIVVADDCSDDATVAMAERYADVQVLRNDRRLGIRGNTARALGYCDTEFVAFLDGDDLMHPRRLERQIEAFGMPDVRIVFALMQLIDADDTSFGTPMGSPGVHVLLDWLRGGMLGGHGTMTIRRPFTNQDVRLDGVADWKMIVDNLRDGSRAVVLDEILGSWRRHPDQATTRLRVRTLLDHLEMCRLISLDGGLDDEERAALRRTEALRHVQLGAALLDPAEPERAPMTALRSLAVAVRMDPRRSARPVLGALVRSAGRRPRS